MLGGAGFRVGAGWVPGGAGLGCRVAGARAPLERGAEPDGWPVLVVLGVEGRARSC